MLIYSTIYHYTNLISILIDGHEDYTQVFKSKIIQFSMHRSIDALRYLSRLIELAWDYYTNERRNKAICQILVTQWIKSPGNSLWFKAFEISYRVFQHFSEFQATDGCKDKYAENSFRLQPLGDQWSSINEHDGSVLSATRNLFSLSILRGLIIK